MFLTKKYKIILLLLVVFFGSFIFLKPVQAFIGTGIFDYSMAVLDALDFADRVLNLLVKLVLLAYISSGFVLLAAHLLQWAITLQVYLHNPMVLGGFNFVLGLVNLFFILALVGIALAYILKIESLQLKKALPRLIIVILLVNFSLLIVGIMIDVAQFFMNEFLRVFGGDFITMALMPLRATVGSLITLTITTITAYVFSAFIPFGSIFALSYLVLYQLLGGDLLGQIFSTIFLVVMNLLLGSIFFIYFILFIVRIAALWILAIFAPLAFFCLIFKQTQKYAEKWFKTVLQWAFLGVIAFFLLGLVTSLFAGAFVKQPGDVEIPPAPGVPSFQLPSSIYNYLFLMIFLAVAWHITMKYVPAGAERITALAKGQIKALGGVAGIASGALNRVRARARKSKLVRKGEEKMVRGLGKIPGVGPGLERGVRSRRREAQRKEVAGEKKKMELSSTGERQEIIDSRLTSTPRRQAALELNAKEGKLRDKDEREVKTIVALGADSSPFAKARPDWAGNLKAISERKEFEKLRTPKEKEEFKKDAIREAVQKQSPESLRKNTQFESLNNLDVFNAMSRNQVREIGREGNEAQKEAIRKLVREKGGEIRKQVENMERQIQLPSPAEDQRKMREKISETHAKLGTFDRLF